MKVRRGVSTYDGPILGQTYYGWAERPEVAGSRLEGGTHLFRFIAWLDSYRLAAKLRRKG